MKENFGKKSDKQLDLFIEPIFKPEDIERVDQAGQAEELNQSKPASEPRGYSKHKFRPPYPQGIDGNPVITKDSDEQEK